MLTPQEITDKVFIKAIFGGYDMTGVDNFLESVCTDYTALYKENAILKGKLKVLVEKVEEYRSTEDSMRMALLTAQRMGEEIKNEANKMKEDTLRNADMEVKARLAESAKRIADEELRLGVAAKETAKFIELSQAIMRKHSEFLTKLESARRAVNVSGQAPRAANVTIAQQPQMTQAQQVQMQPPQQVPQQAPQQVQQSGNVYSEQAANGNPAQYQQQPVMQAQAPIYSQNAQQLSREAQIANTADIIGAAMDRITDGSTGNVQPLTSTGQATPPPAQIHNDEDGHTKVYSISGDDDAITPRPKFDFDDLKFGSNFSADE